MTARLAALCALIDKTPSFIDVGCDHGFVVQYVYAHRLADTITACDISAPSLDKAKKLLGEDGGVRFVCADGAVAAAGYDTVLISGMGGLETVSVLTPNSPNTVILSPQSHVYHVREFLLGRGYEITYDRVIKDRRKYYDVIKAARTCVSAAERIDPLRLEFGMFYDGEGNEALFERLEKMLGAFEKYPSTAENVRKKDAIKEALKCRLR